MILHGKTVEDCVASIQLRNGNLGVIDDILVALADLQLVNAAAIKATADRVNAIEKVIELRQPGFAADLNLYRYEEKQRAEAQVPEKLDREALRVELLQRLHLSD
jgi:hypothetical protein